MHYFSDLFCIQKLIKFHYLKIKLHLTNKDFILIFVFNFCFKSTLHWHHHHHHYHDTWVCCRIQLYIINSGISCVFLVLNLVLALFLRFCGNNKCRGAIWEIAPHLAWMFAIMQLALQLFIKDSVTTR